MGKHYSDRQNKLITKHQQRQSYQELWKDLRAWFGLYYEYVKSDKIFLNKTILRKYKLILKFLKKDFRDDAEMVKHIKRLPPIWILKPWRIEIIIILCFIVFGFANCYCFKIYIGIEWGRGGLKYDLIYAYSNFILSFIYIYMFHRRVKALVALRENLSCIWGIAGQKC